ncbi:MAG: mevalonate kinase [Myxococcaceae bacterium]|nr:mevalonate kinase [Myxococcaceae bacterium]
MTVHLTSFGPGKVILLGEHGVVYGQPALAAPISRGVRAWAVPSKRCSLELPAGLKAEHARSLERAFGRAAKATGHPKVLVTLESDLPLSLGLGSSGALAVAVSRILLEAKTARPAKPAELERVAFELEKEFHGTPSGVDHTTSARGEMILFQKGAVKVVRSPKPVRVLVAIVGERPPTKKTVLALRERQTRWPTRYRRLFTEIGTVAKEGAAAVSRGDLECLGDLMNVNQGLLNAVGLSSEGLEAMVNRLRREGALGAKLTGAGGDGGAVLGLFREPEPLVARLSREGITCFVSQLAGPRAL